MRRKCSTFVLATALAAMVAVGCSSSKSSSSTATTSGSAPTSADSAATTSGGSSGSQASAPGGTASKIKVGFITSATGNASSTFADAEKGAKAAFQAINKAGGINGRQIELVSADDQSSPTGDV